MSGFSDLITPGEALAYEDLYLRAGASWSIPWIILDGNGTGVNLTTCSARCELYNSRGDTSPAFTFANAGSTGGITLAADGTLTLTASPSQTNPLATTQVMQYQYDVRLTSASSQKVFPVTGVFYVFPEWTVG